MVEKFARKKSNDPQQESLRQAKDVWNQDVKLLIAGLIAFKRGMNGRGDPKAGIPPSSIKDPLPPQIGQYLSGIASQYGKVADDAKKIIDAQAYYSEHRRKPHDLGQQTPANSNSAAKAAFVITPSLIVNGSWWGSRTWAYFSLLKKINKQNRKLRLNMLSSALQLNKELKGFEYKIVEREPDAVPAALTILSSVGSEYLAVILRSFDKLKEFYNVEKAVKDKAESEKKPDIKDRKLSIEERKLALQEKKMQEQEEKAKQEAAQAPSSAVSQNDAAPSVPKPVEVESSRENFLKIYSQLVKIDIVLKHIFKMQNVDKTNFATMKKSLNKFSKDVSLLYDLSNRSDHDKSPAELEKLTQDVINQYNYLLQASVAILGAANSFDELAGRIPSPKVSAYLEILQNQEVLKKEAANAVSNWLNKLRMSINPDNISRIKLEMLNSSSSLKQSIDAFMNKLEDREADYSVLSKEVDAINKKLVDLLDQAIDLAQNYMIASRRQEKGKNYHLTDIKQTDIKTLRDLRSNIASHIITEINNKIKSSIKQANIKDSLTYSSIISLAGRKEDIKLKYPNLNVDEIARNDPSGNHKYLSWMVGQLAGGANENDLYPTVQYYHRNTSNFKHKDINKYITLKELEDELKDISEAKAGKEKDKEKFKARQEKLDQAKTVANSTLLFEDESIKLLRINNKEGAVVEGVGSRWCVSATESVNYFDQYNSSNVILYFLLRKNPEGDNFDKIAFAYQRDLENKIIKIDIFDKNDAGITDDIVSSVCPEYPKIKSIMDNEAPQLPDSILVKMKKGSTDIEEVRKYLGALDGSGLEQNLWNLNNKYKDIYIDYMKHPSNDIRRVVANRIDPSFLPQMMNDEDKDVRSGVANRIDPSFLPQMMNDEDRDVRCTVARRDPSLLTQMMNDEDSYVRQIVARRIDPSLLTQMMNDEDSYVRQIVARRIDPSFLPQMMNDEDSYVRQIVAKRIDPSFLPQMMNDEDSSVRYTVAKRIDLSFLPQMMNDEDSDIREIVTHRMNN